jgi:hypothetical protein
MKKLLLSAFLLCTVGMSAQQFVVEYNYARFVRSGIETEWIHRKAIAYYNYYDKKITIEFNGSFVNLIEVGNVTTRETWNGLPYTKMSAKIDYTDDAMIYVFDDARYGIIISYGYNDVLQFAKEIKGLY